jgi:hypothetical protein
VDVHHCWPIPVRVLLIAAMLVWTLLSFFPRRQSTRAEQVVDVMELDE